MKWALQRQVPVLGQQGDVWANGFFAAWDGHPAMPFGDTAVLLIMGGGFLVRILVGAAPARGRTGPFFLPPWPWWAPAGGTSHQVGWSGEARGSRGGAPGGAALTCAPGRAAGAFFSRAGG
jgi:hypothetical protein